MVNRRASLFFWAGLSQTPRHSIAEPERSILGREIAPDSACVKALPLASALPLHFVGKSDMKKWGWARGHFLLTDTFLFRKVDPFGGAQHRLLKG